MLSLLWTIGLNGRGAYSIHLDGNWNIIRMVQLSKSVHNYKQREGDLVTIVSCLGLKFEKKISIIDKTNLYQSLDYIWPIGTGYVDAWIIEMS